MSWLKNVFGGGDSSRSGESGSDQKTPSAQPSPPEDGVQATPEAVDAPSTEPVITLDDPRYASFASARDRYWQAIGTVDEDVIAYLISPEFQGKPAWPTTRQSFRVVRTPRTVIIASDGMSDLFVDTTMQDAGFDCEVYIETPQLNSGDFQDISRSWAFELIENFAANVAHAGGITQQIARYGVLSMELPAPAGIPPEWINADGYVGALINLPLADRDHRVDLGSGAVISMIPLTLITPQETRYAIDNGPDGRSQIAQKLLAAGVGVASDLRRATTAA